jgi:hypothetical protein
MTTQYKSLPSHTLSTVLNSSQSFPLPQIPCKDTGEEFAHATNDKKLPVLKYEAKQKKKKENDNLQK